MAGAFLYDNLMAGAVSVSDPFGPPLVDIPLSNLLDPQPRLRMRWQGRDAAILVDFGLLVPIDCVALVSTTMEDTALVEIRLSTVDPTGIAGDAWSTFGSADTAAAANGNVIFVRAAGPASGRYLLITVGLGVLPFMDIGVLAVGQLWRLTRAQSYGAREGRIILDQRDRNPFTGAEFPVPALFNPRFAAFAAQNMRASEIVGDQRAMVRQLGAVKDALWIPDTGLSRFEMNRRAIWGAAAQPGDDVGAERVNFPGWSQAWRLIERG
jgi:hypothetical protein